jgi:enoyl-CoA hydratase/carnithine racemase
MLHLDRQDGVFVLRMDDGENRFNAQSVAALLAALDEIERDSVPAALVTTGTGKFYSNGLDLAYIATLDAAAAGSFIGEVHKLLYRTLTFPMITVAALNGHAFAAGAMLAIAHDYKLMRQDRGYFCLPEVDIQIPFSGPMQALIQGRLPRMTAHEAMVTGKRFAAEEARAKQIVDEVAAEADVLPRAIALAKSLAGKPRATLATIKQNAYRDMLTAMQTDTGALPGLSG